MEILLVILIFVLVIRWAYLRTRLQELETRIDALTRFVHATPAPQSAAFTAVAPEAPQTSPPPVTSEPRSTPVTPASDLPVMLAPEPCERHAQQLPSTPPLESLSTLAPLSPVISESQVTEAPPPPPRAEAPILASSDASLPHTPRDWEAQVGGNLLNKIGVFVLVIGIALALAYSYKYLGPLGRIAVSTAISLAMLASGVLTEKREHYRIFARGLIGGGWAALYFTTYASQALEPARIIHNAWAGAALLLAVAAGMIVHSLRYRSEAVTGMAYFVAFGGLAITPVTAFSLFALVPLGFSLLYSARRFRWRYMALFGLIATYAVCATRPDTGAPLWQAQTMFAMYWLLFEAFDILNAEVWLMPWNAAGFLAISVAKWQSSNPKQLWAMLAVLSAAYLIVGVLRVRRSAWQPSITLAAALAAVSIFLKLDHQWVTLALLIEAEILYLAAVKLRQGYLRILAAAAFGVELAQLLSVEVATDVYRHWTPIAALTGAFCYLNRVLRREDIAYGFGGLAMVALIAGYEIHDPYRSCAWMLLAIVPFVIGWSLRRIDFRVQAYLLAALGLVWVLNDMTPVSLSIAILVSYGATLSSLLSAEDRFDPEERTWLRLDGSIAAALAATGLIWKVVPGEYIGVSWMAAALLLLELGLRGMPSHFKWQAYAVAAWGALWTYGTMTHWWIPAVASALAYAFAARSRDEDRGAVLAVASIAGTFFALTAMHRGLPLWAVGSAWMALAIALTEFRPRALKVQGNIVAVIAMLPATIVWPHHIWTLAAVLVAHYFEAWRTRQRLYTYTAALLSAAWMYDHLPASYVSVGWAAFALALCLATRYLASAHLEWQSYAFAAVAFLRCWYTNLEGNHDALLTAVLVTVCLYLAQIASQRAVYSIPAAALASLIPYYCVAPHSRTVVWGSEGLLLLSTGFPLRDPVLRISGLALLFGCIGKLFFWDLRHLETLPRIFSFIMLGLFLIGVSWVYTRFRDRIAELL